jgi:hypothetical protein
MQRGAAGWLSALDLSGPDCASAASLRPSLPAPPPRPCLAICCRAAEACCGGAAEA